MFGTGYDLKDGIKITGKTCGTENAFWYAEDREITYCYEMAAFHAALITNWFENQAEEEAGADDEMATDDTASKAARISGFFIVVLPNSFCGECPVPELGQAFGTSASGWPTSIYSEVVTKTAANQRRRVADRSIRVFLRLACSHLHHFFEVTNYWF